MLRFLLGRLANGAIVMVLVSMLSFSLFNFIGDPVSNLVGENATVNEREAMRRHLRQSQERFSRSFGEGLDDGPEPSVIPGNKRARQGRKQA